MQGDKKSYLLILHDIPIGAAYCKMIFEDGKPVDWIYLDANAAYEKVTGLKDVINRRVSDVIPDIKKDNPEILNFYGRVSTTGKSSRFESYIYPLKIWLSISAYCPEKGHFVAILDNITERKAAEQALKESGGKYRSLVENAGEAIYIVQDGKIKFANDRCFEMVKYTREELCSGDFLRFIHPHDREMVGSRHLARLHGEKVIPVYPFRFIDKDGSIKWFDLRATLVQWEGKPATLNFSTDITAQKIAEDELEHRSREMADIIDFLPDAIFALNKNGEVISWNRAMEEMTGIPASEMIGKGDHAYETPFYGMARPGLIDLILKDDPETRAKYDSIKSSGNSLSTEVFCPAINNGKGAWVFAKASPLYDADGNLTGAIESIRDVTASKNATEALKKSEEQYRTLFENAGEGIFIAQDEKLKFVNKRTCEIAHRKKEELLSRPFFDFLYPADRDMVVKNYRARISGKLEGFVYPFRIVGQDNSIIWVELGATRVEWEGRPATLNFMTDITARKKAEDELKEYNRKLTDIIDFLPDATFAVDKNHRVTFWNHAVEEMTGIPASEMIGKGDYAYAVPFYGEARPLLMDTVWVDNHATKIKYPYITHSGDSLFTEVFCPALYGGKGAWVFAKASPLYDAEGNLAGAIESVRDITISRNAVEALRKSEEQYRLLADTADDMIWTMDSQLHFTYSSPSVKRMRGFDPEEANTQSLADILTPESLQSAMHTLEAQLKEIESGQVRTMRLETEVLRKDRSSFWAESTVRPFYDGKGKLAGYIGITRDITRRKAAEQDLKESEEKFRRIFENSNDAIFISPKEGKFIDANESMCKMFGYTREEILNLPAVKLYENPADRAAFQSEIEKTGSIKNYEMALVRKDGAKITGMLNSTVRRDRDGNIVGYQGIFRDITEIQRLQDERQKIAKLESIGTLAGGIAHDFNNILQGILGNIGLARLETKEGDHINEYLKEAEKASLSARNLTYQFLTFSKGGLPIKKKILLSACINDAVTLALRGSNVNYQLSIAPDLRPVDADEGQIGQVITNIVLNAQQAMPAGGTAEVIAENIDLTGEGRLGRSLPLGSGKYIRISITDHGTGIPAEHIGNIFDPYFTTKQKGSGLGLATSYSIVRKHNGHIGVESTVGKGSTFFIYLPASAEETNSKRTRKEKIVKGSGRILIMDDEDIVRATTGKMLKKLGYDVELAVNGEEAITKYQQSVDSKNPFVTVILDLTIPGGMGGLETLEILKKINPQLIAIVSSGYADISAMAEYRKFGFKGMVAKPYTPAQLSKTLADIIKKS